MLFLWMSIAVILRLLVHQPVGHLGPFMFLAIHSGNVDLAALEVESKASVACPVECGDCLMIGRSKTQ